MTNNIYLDNKKYRLFSFFVAIVFSSLIFFTATLLKVNMYDYKMPKEIKVHLVNNIPINKPVAQKTEQSHVEKKIIKPHVHKIIKHIAPHPIQKPKPIEKPIVSKIPPPEPTKVVQESTKNQEHDVTKKPEKPAKENSAYGQKEQLAPPQPISSEKPSKNEIAVYLSKVYEIIEEHKRYPSLAKRRGDSGTVFIRVAISKNGEINNVILLNSSGSYILDEYTKALIKNLKFPPPPKGAITFDLKVHYRLNEGG